MNPVRRFFARRKLRKKLKGPFCLLKKQSYEKTINDALVEMKQKFIDNIFRSTSPYQYIVKEEPVECVGKESIRQRQASCGGRGTDKC